MEPPGGGHHELAFGGWPLRRSQLLRSTGGVARLQSYRGHPFWQLQDKDPLCSHLHQQPLGLPLSSSEGHRCPKDLLRRTLVSTLKRRTSSLCVSAPVSPSSPPPLPAHLLYSKPPGGVIFPALRPVPLLTPGLLTWLTRPPLSLSRLLPAAMRGHGGNPASWRCHPPLRSPPSSLLLPPGGVGRPSPSSQ